MAFLRNTDLFFGLTTIHVWVKHHKETARKGVEIQSEKRLGVPRHSFPRPRKIIPLKKILEQNKKSYREIRSKIWRKIGEKKCTKLQRKANILGRI